MKEMRLFLRKYKKRINKVIKGGKVLSILFALTISLLATPFDIYAETITSHVVGTNVWTDRIDYVVVDSSANQFRNYCNVHVEIVFDSDYVGWQNLGLAVYYYSVNFSNNTWTRYSRQVSGNYYINGNSLEIIVPISFDSIAQPYYQAYNGTGQTLPQSDSSINLSFTTQGNVIEYGELSTLEDILSVLNDIYVNTSVDIYGELQNIVTELGLSNQYLETLTKIRQFNIPFESISSLMYPLDHYETYDLYNINYFQFPLFNINNGNFVTRFHMIGNSTKRVILLLSANAYNLQSLSNSIEVSNNLNGSIQLSNFKQIYTAYDNSFVCIVSFDVFNELNGLVSIKSLGDYFYCPIYNGYLTDKNISTDFALLFGLSNSLLDNLDIIAQGTNQSNQSSSNLETQKGSFDTTSNNLYTSENAFNTDMNNKLNNIDTSFNPTNAFGSKFLQSADWVRTQFGNLTNSSPFGTLLSFSMLLGLSLLIIGKVFK